MEIFDAIEKVEAQPANPAPTLESKLDTLIDLLTKQVTAGQKPILDPMPQTTNEPDIQIDEEVSTDLKEE